MSPPDLSPALQEEEGLELLLTPERFKRWRRFMGLKQKDAALLLGLKKRVIQYYEKGDRDGKAVEIPKSVELACLALTLGHSGFDAERMPDGTPLDLDERDAEHGAADD